MLILLLACTPTSTPVEETVDPGPQWVFDTPALESTPTLEVVDVFSETETHGFSLELDSQARNDLRSDPYSWTEAVFIAGEVPYPIGIRIKGSSTYRDYGDKPSFKLRFDYVHSELRFNGMRRLNLHNMVLDPMLSSEVLNWGFFRAAALPAPRVGYARLDINGRDEGLYSIVEDIEDDFLKQWFGDSHGNLYENAENYCDLTRVGCFDKDEWDEGNDDALEGLISAARLNGQDWLGEMKERMDWERFVSFLAMERVVAHWDSYSYDVSNYRLYHDPTADTFAFIPWSGDLGFGYRPWSYYDCGRHGVDPADYDLGLLARTCEQVPECHNAVLDAMLVHADMLEDMDAGGMVQPALDRVRDDAESDPENYDMDHFEYHGACVEEFITDRPDVVRAWVAENR